MTDDIHGSRKSLNQALSSLDKQPFSEGDKKAIREFIDKLLLQNISLSRRAKYVNHLKVVARTLNELTGTDRGLCKATKEDLDKFKTWLLESEKKPSTKRDFALSIKRFYQWYSCDPKLYARWRKKHIFPDIVEDMDIQVKRNERFLPSDLLTEAEIEKLIEAASTPMLRAYIAMKAEIGPRPGEDLLMRVGDIIRNGTELIARLGHHGGKTGERLIPLIKSVPPHNCLA